MAYPFEIGPDTPCTQQRLQLPETELESLQEWAIDGTGITASARVTDSEGRVALIQNSWTDGWFLPGGAVESGEHPREAAHREIREEIGLEATIEDEILGIDQTYTSESGKEWFSALFVVYSASADGDIPDTAHLGVTEDEITGAQWFETLPDELHDGGLLRSYL
jgi:8-oxo-dGTP diphosphatase